MTAIIDSTPSNITPIVNVQKQEAIEKYSQLNKFYEFGALLNGLTIHVKQIDSYNKLKDYLVNSHNTVIKEIEANEWFKEEKALMQKEYPEICITKDIDYDPNYVVTMTDVFRKV